MKGRAFTAVVLSLLLLLSGLGIGGWWLLWQRGPLRLAHQRLEMPRAARFVPASAALSLYLLSDGEQPVAYARAVAPTRQRRRAAEAIARLRDGAFAAAGLDYDTELAGWLGSDIAVALFDDPVAAAAGASAEQPASGWLLALASRDDDGARRFLQRFWQTRSLAGTDLQVSRYRGMGMISGRGALLGSQPVPLATALVDDDLVLIASGRNLLERALDVSQIRSLNQTGLPQLQPGLEAFGQGAALLLAAPSALQSWLALPPLPVPEDPAAPPPFLMAVLRPEGRDLVLRSRLSLPAASPLHPLEPTEADALLAAVPGSPASLALLQDPAALQADPLLGPLLQRALGRRPLERAEQQGPLPELLARSISGALLAAQGPDGWWMGSEAGASDPAVLQPLAEQAGLLQAPLEVAGRPLQVWTHLELPLRPGGRGRRGAAPVGTAQPLQATLAGWREQRQGLAWWAGRLEQVQAAAAGADLERLRRRLQLLEHPEASLQWSLDGDGARALLRSWQPWRLLSALAGGGLDSPVRGLALAVSMEAASAPSLPAERVSPTGLLPAVEDVPDRAALPEAGVLPAAEAVPAAQAVPAAEAVPAAQAVPVEQGVPAAEVGPASDAGPAGEAAALPAAPPAGLEAPAQARTRAADAKGDRDRAPESDLGREQPIDGTRAPGPAAAGPAPSDAPEPQGAVPAQEPLQGTPSRSPQSQDGVLADGDRSVGHPGDGNRTVGDPGAGDPGDGDPADADPSDAAPGDGAPSGPGLPNFEAAAAAFAPLAGEDAAEAPLITHEAPTVDEPSDQGPTDEGSSDQGSSERGAAGAEVDGGEAIAGWATDADPVDVDPAEVDPAEVDPAAVGSGEVESGDIEAGTIKSGDVDGSAGGGTERDGAMAARAMLTPSGSAAAFLATAAESSQAEFAVVEARTGVWAERLWRRSEAEGSVAPPRELLPAEPAPSAASAALPEPAPSVPASSVPASSEPAPSVSAPSVLEPSVPAPTVPAAPPVVIEFIARLDLGG
ncbi:MAG: DUF3352 domain-containing protein [Cyanobium sp.]